jgi:hypothetical protein
MPEGTAMNSAMDAHATARVMRRRTQRLMRRGDARKALSLMRETAAREGSGAAYCWLGDALLAADRPSEALEAFRQALYCFRHHDMRGRARSVARIVLKLDPGDSNARRRAA